MRANSPKKGNKSVLSQMDALMAIIDEEIQITSRQMDTSHMQVRCDESIDLVGFQFQPTISAMEIKHRYSKAKAPSELKTR